MNRCREFYGEMIVAILSRAASSNWRRRNVILVAHRTLLTIWPISRTTKPGR
jgi:hypothetical protein